VYAWAGGTQRLDGMVRTITRLLEDHLEDNPCQVFSMNMKVRLANDKDYVYADATVTCDPRDVANDLSDHISDPLLVVEVLSDSTEKHDQGTKFDLYRDRDTLIEYMLIETEHVGVEVRTRDADGVWSATTYGPGQAVYLASVDMDILVQELYRGTAL